MTWTKSRQVEVGLGKRRIETSECWWWCLGMCCAVLCDLTAVLRSVENQTQSPGTGSCKKAPSATVPSSLQPWKALAWPGLACHFPPWAANREPTGGKWVWMGQLILHPSPPLCQPGLGLTYHGDGSSHAASFPTFLGGRTFSQWHYERKTYPTSTHY